MAHPLSRYCHYAVFEHRTSDARSGEGDNVSGRRADRDDLRARRQRPLTRTMRSQSRAVRSPESAITESRPVPQVTRSAPPSTTSIRSRPAPPSMTSRPAPPSGTFPDVRAQRKACKPARFRRESAWIAPRRSPVRARLAPLKRNPRRRGGFVVLGLLGGTWRAGMSVRPTRALTRVVASAT
jgi:hypothetical protein